MIPETELQKHPDTGQLIPEIWLPINGFVGKYEISNYGRVKSLMRFKETPTSKIPIPEKLLKPETLTKGYFRVFLSDANNSTHKQVHRLVAEHFFHPSRLMVNHKDFNKQNNFFLNLEYTTARENTHHYIKSLNRGMPIGVRAMRRGFQARFNVGKTVKYLGTYGTQDEAARAYDIALGNHG